MSFLSLSGERKVQKNKKRRLFEYLLIAGHLIYIIPFNHHYKPIRERDPTHCPNLRGTIHTEYNEEGACCSCVMWHPKLEDITSFVCLVFLLLENQPPFCSNPAPSILFGGSVFLTIGLSLVI